MQSPIVSAILREFEERQRKNPRYSLRALAQHLDVNVSTLSRLIRGQRRASGDLVKSIADRLHLSPSMREQLILAELGIEEDPHAYERELTPMTSEQISAMSDWEVLSIQSLIETDLIITSERQIAELFGIPEEKALRALKVLQSQKMIEFHEGQWKSTYRKLIADRKNNPEVVRLLAEFMEMGRRNLLERDDAFQSYSGLVMPVDPRRIPEAHQRIRQFRNELARFLSGGKKTDVFRLSIQLFPLTQTGFRPGSRQGAR